MLEEQRRQKAAHAAEQARLAEAKQAAAQVQEETKVRIQEEARAAKLLQDAQRREEQQRAQDEVWIQPCLKRRDNSRYENCKLRLLALSATPSYSIGASLHVKTGCV